MDRLTASGLRRIGFERVTRVKRDHIELNDGTILPLHRILAVEAGGRILWRRGGDIHARENPEEDTENEG